MAGARDGQLRIRRGGDSPPWGLDLYDDAAALWRDVAYALGVPVLRGPYVVDFTDIPHDTNAMTLWTPAVGEVLLRLFPDWQNVTQWDTGALQVGQLGVMSAGLGYMAYAGHGQIADGPTGLTLDTSVTGDGMAAAVSGDSIYVPAVVFNSTAPVQIAWYSVPDPDPSDASVGHVELYALVARAVAP